MIKRYSRPEMSEIWSEQAKFETWLKIELIVCEVQAQLGLIPAEALSTIKSKARFDIKRINEIEAEVQQQ